MMLFKGNSSKLELLIEKIHSTRDGGPEDLADSHEGKIISELQK